MRNSSKRDSLAGRKGLCGQPVCLRVRQGGIFRLDHRAAPAPDTQATALNHLTDHQIAIAELEGIVGAKFAQHFRKLRNPNRMKSFDFLVLALLLLLVLPACSKKVAQQDGGDVDYYTCTMHPSVRSKDPGKCPICSMDLVPVMKKDALAAGSGHMHSSVETPGTPATAGRRNRVSSPCRSSASR